MAARRHGAFGFTFDPRSSTSGPQTYVVTNNATGKDELARVVHLTFFSTETSPATYHSLVRLIVRGNKVNYTR